MSPCVNHIVTRRACVTVFVVLSSLVPLWGDEPPMRRNYVFPPLPPGLEESQGMIETVLDQMPDVEALDLMRFVHEEFPMEMRRFRQIAEKSPGEAMTLITRIIGESRELLVLKQKDPEQYQRTRKQRQLERRAIRLGEDIALLEAGPDRERLTKELQTVLQESFDIKQNLIKGEVEEIEDELAKLSDLVRRREEKRAELIERRISTLTGASQDVEW